MRWLTVALGCLTLASASASIVAQDWYYRESLKAIADWERVLSELPGDQAACLAPVTMPAPTDGAQVAWPNPIPALLEPPGDEAEPVAVRLDGDSRLVRIGAHGAWRAMEEGEVERGYQHPGGGDRDRWYHAYERRFDALTAFAIEPSDLAIEAVDVPTWALGDNTVRVRIRGIDHRPEPALVQALYCAPGAEPRPCAVASKPLSDDAMEYAVTVDLGRPGGGLLLVHLGTATLPLLTFVEDLPAVLTSLEQILSDVPDAQAERTLSDLQQAAGAVLSSASPADRWRELFTEASALRDRLLLGRIDFDELLFLRRMPFDSEQPFMDAHHLYNRPGGGIYRLSPVRPDGEVAPVVDSLGEGVYRDVFLHWEADRALFSFGNGSDTWDGEQSYHIYEVTLQDGAVRQLTFGPKNDCEPLYLPSGQIAFTSDRAEHFIMCGGDRHSANLHLMEGDGSGIRQLSFNVFNDFNPTLLPDGRILYSRWEYNERSVTSLHNPFTMQPDGTMVSPYYGNATIRPNVVMFPRPIPGSHAAMALFTAHHGQTHGPIGVIDTWMGVDGDEPLTVLTPGIPTTGEKHEDSYLGWFSDPVPLSEDTYLCSYTPTCVPWRERSWAVYVGDRHGNLALVYRDPMVSCAEPLPLMPRPAPAALPTAGADTDRTDAFAELLLLDVSEGLEGATREECKSLRVLEDVPRVGVHRGGVIATAGTSIYTIKRVLGTVPIEDDGSALLRVPANRNIYFEILDEGGLEVQRMRSVVCLKPDERRTCVGCHESRTSAPPNAYAKAALREPSIPQPPPWGDGTVSFLRDIQPMLNDHCVRCHSHDRAANGVILTDELTPQYTIAYEELLPYLATANAMRWDVPEDVYAQPARTYGSGASRLVTLLRERHHGVELLDEEWERLTTWIDTNAVYYDTYETAHYPNRDVFAGRRHDVLGDVYSRRCADCHGGGNGQYGTWWLSLNRREPQFSRLLAAPLAQGAGGWQRCGDPVFASTEDPDYGAALDVLLELGEALKLRPREDLASLEGTPAALQLVALSAAPEPRPPRTIGTEDGWAYLSTMPWASATAGWSPQPDGRPVRDADIEGVRLRQGTLAYARGLGTHAPSLITYRLDGNYTRLCATAQAGEAGGTVCFRVLLDGVVAFESPVLKGPSGCAEIDIDITDAKELVLEVTDAGDGINCDMANWLDARVR